MFRHFRFQATLFSALQNLVFRSRRIFLDVETVVVSKGNACNADLHGSPRVGRECVAVAAAVCSRGGEHGMRNVKTVQPILSNNCYKCHGGDNHRGGLQLDTKERILKGGKDGTVIVPGHPEQGSRCW